MTDIGKRLELFVDRTLVERTDGVDLRLHAPQPREVVLTFDQPWEGPFTGSLSVNHDGGKVKLHYFGFPHWPTKKHLRCLCVAESDDGIHFVRPNIGLHERDGSTANNVVHPIDDEKHYVLNTFIDERPGVADDERFKGIGGNYHGGGCFGWTSPDGIMWQRVTAGGPMTDEGPLDSENVAFWSEHEQCYVAYFRSWIKRDAAGRTGVLKRNADGSDWEFVGETEDGERWTLPLEGGLMNDGLRWVARSTSPDFVHWSPPVQMVSEGAPDEHIYTCLPRPYFRAPHVYIAPGARFVRDRQVLTDAEADSVGIREQFRGKTTDIVLMSSRGGVRLDRTFLESWSRPGFDPADWIYGSNYPSFGFVQTGEAELSFYVNEHFTRPDCHARRFTLRLDGFVSAHGGFAGGELVTKAITFSGARLVLNYATSAAGSVRVGIEDEAGQPIEGFGLADAVERVGNRIADEARWRGGVDVSALAGRAVRLRFAIKDADVFSYRFADTP